MATYNGTTPNDTIQGSNLADLMFGLAGNDSLTGNDGADTLDGGAGADTLTGHNGDDTFVVDSTRDAIIDITADANDRVLASITIDLQSALYDGVEHVTLTGTAALNATGDDGNNMLIGNAGANKLDGKGANDTMAGGGGNDTYEVDALDEPAIEYASGGTDQVNSSSHYVLGAYLENLTLTGTDNNNGDGNVLANKVTGNAGANGLFGDAGNDTLTGNDGADTLDGGTGTDSMSGGKGNDTYVVDDPGDKVTDGGPAGETDTVISVLTYTLGTNLENLDLDGIDDIDGTGNTLNNIITGNSGFNLLSGLAGNDSLFGGGLDQLAGGDGADTLTGAGGEDTLVGGAGNDAFAFSKAAAADADLIGDFNGLPNADKIDLSLLLSGATKDNAAEFLQTVDSGASTLIRVDVNGGADSFRRPGDAAGRQHGPRRPDRQRRHRRHRPRRARERDGHGRQRHPGGRRHFRPCAGPGRQRLAERRRRA
jgi:Ca2+-binding RTX toxin-like protein